MLSLAHLSDVHLGPLPPVRPRELLNKRATGFLSWHYQRKQIHLRSIADLCRDDIRRARPDHVAFTGDLVNLSLPAEFTAGASWLATLGAPDEVTFVPGNHDAYVRVPWQEGVGRWQAYMTGDLRIAPAEQAGTGRFPFVRGRGNVALIGVSTALPTAPFFASGLVGGAQLAALDHTLRRLRERGFFRVLLIHHPPLPFQIGARKGLADAAALNAVLQREGAELVLFGHNHDRMHAALSSRFGPVHLLGIPSASARATRKKPASAWHLIRIARELGAWKCSVGVRQFNAASNAFEDGVPFELPFGASRDS
jgi:3',5'-cyclic AMP phosphodiesterase CpdA